MPDSSSKPPTGHHMNRLFPSCLVFVWRCKAIANHRWFCRRCAENFYPLGFEPRRCLVSQRTGCGGGRLQATNQNGSGMTALPRSAWWPCPGQKNLLKLTHTTPDGLVEPCFGGSINSLFHFPGFRLWFSQNNPSDWELSEYRKRFFCSRMQADGGWKYFPCN